MDIPDDDEIEEFWDPRTELDPRALWVCDGTLVLRALTEIESLADTIRAIEALTDAERDAALLMGVVAKKFESGMTNEQLETWMSAPESEPPGSS